MCICRWLNTGVQREDIPSVEEKSASLMLNLGNRLNFGKGVTDNTCRSRWALVNDSVTGNAQCTSKTRMVVVVMTKIFGS